MHKYSHQSTILSLRLYRRQIQFASNICTNSRVCHLRIHQELRPFDYFPPVFLLCRLFIYTTHRIKSFFIYLCACFFTSICAAPVEPTISFSLHLEGNLVWIIHRISLRAFFMTISFVESSSIENWGHCCYEHHKLNFILLRCITIASEISLKISQIAGGSEKVLCNMGDLNL